MRIAIFRFMNRLVIIGNGFDLAHGLPTSYRNFIDDFWKSLKNNYKDKMIKKLVFVKENDKDYFDEVYGEIHNFKSFKEGILNECLHKKGY